ncbi:CidA/LrgA family protein [Pistricoccus aurantiacus]|uniref:CidA/LrgA family protein n=1 Tax=Pistricoccus aurantiacus TaxID=1883414 RepID=A0A5B8SRV8_9GAMM|nr:CidA/LrgA family protein [Pistricoccus aurantiacus]QEA39882.1 CidA/LrgA family protein [Pistricoccus aurantiacus]
MPLIAGMSLLLICQFLGELVVRSFALPVPGPVMGMLILLIGLMINGRVPDSLRKAGEGLLRYLTLLFVPAGVGVMVHSDLIRADFWTLVITLILSTAVTLGVTGKVMNWLVKRLESRGGRP